MKTVASAIVQVWSAYRSRQRATITYLAARVIVD